MRKITIILSVLVFIASGCGQATKKQSEVTNSKVDTELIDDLEQSQQCVPKEIICRILSQSEVEQLFTDELKKTFDIQYPIWRVYAFGDNLGEYRIVLTESVNIQIDGNLIDTLHHNIKGFFFRLENNTLTKEREIYDFINSGEISIWFWTKFCSFSDIDDDGLVDPIIVYGSKPKSDSESYRMNILVYFKGEKYAQRHTDGDLDFMRSTQIDKDFYTLPKVIQENVKSITEEMLENGNILSW
ncbi:MAG: hypothetical protein LBR55_02545 [Bacteroidales bacterium]|jgi:hypothetical protein|nr:hypothetical protein [Bacteroidales bacterium]